MFKTWFKNKVILSVVFFFLFISVFALLSLAYRNNSFAAANTVGEIYFTLLHTNDEHSALVPSPLVDDHPYKENPSMGGIKRLAGAVSYFRNAKQKAGEPTVLVSAADYLGGSPFSWLATAGKAPELSLMLSIGYDVITIGNHEFDYGPDLLADYFRTAGFPAASARTAVVASNTHPPEGHPLSKIGLQKTHLIELDNGLTLGFFGLIGKRALRVAPFTDPIAFSDQHAAALEAVAELRETGADVIIALSHSGIEEDRDLAREVPGIHIIVGGDCHVPLYDAILENDTIILQAGSLLKYLGVVELAFNPSTGNLRMRNQKTNQPLLFPLDHTVPECAETAVLLAAYTKELNAMIARLTADQFDQISDTIVYTDFPLPDKPAFAESPFGNFVTDAMRLVAEEVTGEKVHLAFQANGSIRGGIIPGSMPYSQGKVSFYDLVSLIGLGIGHDGEPGYPMVSVYFTGEEIRRILEISVLLSELLGDSYYLQVSGLRKTYDPGRAVLLRIPFMNTPIPTSRAVLSAELYTGTGVQDSDNFAPLLWGDETLFHVVSDYYIASFLPQVGDMLPNLALVMKDRYGNPVDIGDRIIHRNGQELKVWQTVVEYAAGQPAEGPDNSPLISEKYDGLSDRLVQVRTIPLLLWPLLGLVLLVTLIAFLIQRKRRKHKEATVLR